MKKINQIPQEPSPVSGRGDFRIISDNLPAGRQVSGSDRLTLK